MLNALSTLFFLAISISTIGQVLDRPSNYEIENAPEWAQLMYADNPNVFEVDRAYNSYFDEHEFAKSYHTQFYKRWRISVEDLVQNDGFYQLLSEGDMMRIKEELFEKSLQNRASGTWSLVGPIIAFNSDGVPVSMQSNIYSIDQAPSDSDVLYCGSETGEVYRSSDGGNSWINVSLNELWNKGVRSIEIHPNDPNIVYIGSGSNIYKSINGGLTWTDVLYVWNLYANEILINPSTPNTILAATYEGVYRTIDAGLNWTQLYSDLAYDLKTNTDDDNTVYLLKHNPDLEICQFMRSTDAGSTFIVQSNGWYSSTDPDRHDGGGRLAVSNADSDRVYAYLIGEAKAGDTGYIGLYKSDDSGSTWTLPNGPTGGPYDDDHMNLAIGYVGWQYHQGYYNCALMASDTDPDQIRLGGLNLYGSDDAGSTFYPLAGYVDGPFAMHVDMQDFRTFGNTTWITTDGGIYRSDDFFTSSEFESRMYGIHSAEYWGFGSGWNEDVMIGGLYHNGNLSFHENYGEGNFLQLGGGEPASGYVNQGENRRVYSSDINGKILPLNIGDPVQSVGFGIDPNEGYWAVHSSELEFDPRCYSIAYTGKNHQLWRTDDKGTTFELFATFGLDLDNRITYIEPSWSDPNVLYVCQQNVIPSSSGAIWKTIDSGLNWFELDLPNVDNSQKILIQVDPTDPDKVWIAFHSSGDGQIVYKSVNGGGSWTNLTTSTLDGESPRSLNLIGGTDGGVYLATNHTVYYRNNSMSDWECFGDGLPALINTGTARPFYRDGKLRVASNGKGIWESVFYEEPSEPVAQIMVDKLATIQHCSADTFHYVDHSMLNHTGATWEWTFLGGSPAAANTWNANVTYQNPGTYLTILTVTDNDGDSDTDSLYITVDPYIPPSDLDENFEEFFPPDNFEITNLDEDITWALKDNVGGYDMSSQSMFMRGYDYDAIGQVDDAVVSVDMSYLQDAWLTFDLAYAVRKGYSDSLEILISIDCGESYQSLYFKEGSDLASTAEFEYWFFVPNYEQWRTDSIDLSGYMGSEDVSLVFRHYCGGGQNLYIDNINIEGLIIVGNDEITKSKPRMMVYPNPINSQNTLHLYTDLNEPILVELYTLDGKRVYRHRHDSVGNISISDLSSGSYLYVLSSSRQIKKGKLVVQ